MKTYTRKHIEEALQSLKKKKQLLDEKEITEDYQKKIKIMPTKRGRLSAKDKENLDAWKENNIYTAKEFEETMASLVNNDCKSVEDYKFVFLSAIGEKVPSVIPSEK